MSSFFFWNSNKCDKFCRPTFTCIYLYQNTTSFLIFGIKCYKFVKAIIVRSLSVIIVTGRIKVPLFAWGRFAILFLKKSRVLRKVACSMKSHEFSIECICFSVKFIQTNLNRMQKTPVLKWPRFLASGRGMVEESRSSLSYFLFA